MSFIIVVVFCLLFTFSRFNLAASEYVDQPFAEVLRLAEKTSGSNPLLVDLGYAIYAGRQDISRGYNVWNGIRYAASTGGRNRWQAPRVPPVDRTAVITADRWGDWCPQSFGGDGSGPIMLGLTGNEDCLYLNIYAPQNATNLPVMVWIHGGGYGVGNNDLDFSEILKANGDNFIGVAIQYRLGAFGFLSSAEVAKRGVVNAGILDQIRALQWVQAYIKQFGGDPSRVTIGGESSGAGAVMLLGMAYNGTLGTSLFINSIAASPFQPQQRRYDAEHPTHQYNAFAEQAGCALASSTFDCLLDASSEVLQNASSYVSTGALYGDWAFLPVTDGSLIPDVPARYLGTGRLNGLRTLSGHNALEGFPFTPRNITSQAKLVSWLKLRFPALTNSDITTILETYPTSNASDNPNAILFATDGVHTPTALDQSCIATGQQQRASNILAEIIFMCPSYWLAEAYSPSSNTDHQSQSSSNDSDSTLQGGYKYQYSVITAVHAVDVPAYFAAPAMPHSSDFALAFKQILGNFIAKNDPSIDSLVANGASRGDSSTHPASVWPRFLSRSEQGAGNTQSMINLNETFTGAAISPDGIPFNYPEADVRNSISLVNAWSWEGGRGRRCDLWRRLAARVAEERDTTDSSSTTSNTDPSATSATTSTTSAHNGSGSNIKVDVGIGVGVGIGVIAMLAGLGVAFWKWRTIKGIRSEAEDGDEIDGLKGPFLTDYD